jgi:hypothetical protein
MEQQSSEVEALKCLMNDLYEQESKHILAHSFRDLNETAAYEKKSSFELEFPRGYIFQVN